MSPTQGLEALSADVIQKLDRAQQFLDAGQTEGWSPSTILKAAWFMAASNLDVENGISPLRTNKAIERVNRAYEWVESKLDAARDRYRQGFYANPFGEPVKRDEE